MSGLRSVYSKILVWCFATLLLSMVAVAMVPLFVFSQTVGKGQLL